VQGLPSLNTETGSCVDLFQKSSFTKTAKCKKKVKLKREDIQIKNGTETAKKQERKGILRFKRRNVCALNVTAASCVM
jgi:hypothetical protein